MFRRRKRHGLTLGNLLGLVFTIVGVITLIYIIPFTFWIFIFGCGCVVVGMFIFRL